MRLPFVTRSLVSGALVYVLATACAATSHQSLEGGDGGGPSVEGFRDAVADVVDELGNPVPDAKAGPTDPPDVATEPCTTVLPFNGFDGYFAVHDYPGKTRIDLAALQLLATSGDLAGYTDTIGAGIPFVRDGRVAVYCGGAAAAAKKVTFILPK